MSQCMSSLDMKQHFFNFTCYKTMNNMIRKDMEGSGHEMS
jgi:hypothetical protein